MAKKKKVPEEGAGNEAAPTTTDTATAVVEPDNPNPGAVAASVEYMEVDPDIIVANPEDDMRKTPPSDKDIEALAYNIVMEGQHQPVKCRWDQGKLRLVSGFCRLKAIKMANAEGLSPSPLKIRVVAEEMEDAAAFMASISTNLKVIKTNAMDLAWSIERLANLGKSQTEIAEIIGSSPTQISHLRRLMDLPVELQRKVQSGEIKRSAAVFLALRDPADRRAMLDKLAQLKLECNLENLQDVAQTLAEEDRERAAASTQVEGEGAGEGQGEEGAAFVQADEEADLEGGEGGGEATSRRGSRSQSTAETKKRGRGRPKKEDGGLAPRTLKQVKVFWEELSQVGEDEEESQINKLAKEVLKFMAGKLSPKQMTTRLEKFQEGEL